jgi:hypothetical protein
MRPSNRFPWESAFTGAEVTPDCCPETSENQQHITADVSLAARQYFALTHDTDWLINSEPVRNIFGHKNQLFNAIQYCKYV